MEGALAGHIVVVSFPFDKVAGGAKRPALVVADLDSSTVVMCQVTADHYGDNLAIDLPRDSVDGGMPRDGFVRPNRVFTADKSVVKKVVGAVSPTILWQTKTSIRNIISP